MRKVDSGKGLILTLERSTTFIQVHRKENLETLEAINYLSAKLGIFPSDFSYTGIKDKRAITYQAVVKKVTPQRLKELGNAVEKKGLGVSHIYSVSQSLRLCQLQGNQFDIIVRDLKLHNNEPTSSLKEQICEAIENVKKNGFINYYGSQRFGQGQNIQINQTGLALLNEEMVHMVTAVEEMDNKYTINQKKETPLHFEFLQPVQFHNASNPSMPKLFSRCCFRREEKKTAFSPLTLLGSFVLPSLEILRQVLSPQITSTESSGLLLGLLFTQSVTSLSHYFATVFRPAVSCHFFAAAIMGCLLPPLDFSKASPEFAGLSCHQRSLLLFSIFPPRKLGPQEVRQTVGSRGK
ncbi:pseudouridylate synthase 7 homolog-like protein isoform X2 [Crotalus tigris]|uniref:pseudouridylate synthase 7 homolog-like protein isoform X2 n=1 Tax=Crotalus tigris TaxID=88082 RepID=UPI00192F9FD3|nr:pseudouridylate synthase 7 homolog-like protein isoform X2 [Crotalus tigris]